MALRLNLASGAHPLPGFVNLDKEDGWMFEDGIPYPAESIEGLTCSHGLMHVALEHWPFVFSEFARVLKPDGVVRITEDATDNPRSPRYGGYPDAVTLTSFALVKAHLAGAGLATHGVGAGLTVFRDDSLMQSWHGGAPKCFFIEGRKP